jgi:hypothetical protein
VINFVMGSELVQFEFDLPPIDQMVDELRHCPGSRLYSGAKNATFDHTGISDTFPKLPIAEAMESPFNIANFKLDGLSATGQLFHGLEEQWIEPWRETLRSHDFSWEECFSIVFISGKGCATNYHTDVAHVMLWQRYGAKLFNGLKDPDRWTTLEERYESDKLNQTRPAEITEDDILQYELKPGAVLWNTFTTPHWVDATDEVAASLAIVHRGLRLDGQLCPHENEMRQYGRQLEEKGEATSERRY